MFPAQFFCCLGEFRGAAGFTWAGLMLQLPPYLQHPPWLRGVWRGGGRLRGRRNAHSPGGGQRVPGAERSGVGPADLSEKTNAWY